MSKITQKKYMLRMHTARMDTKYGVDVARLFDDPVKPQYTKDEAVEVLMDLLGYVPNEKDDSEYPGFWEGDVGAYFDYDGYEDIEIPESIICRIMEGAK